MRSPFLDYSALLRELPSGTVAEYDEFGPYLSFEGATVGGVLSEASRITSNVSQSKSSDLAPLLCIPRSSGPINQSKKERKCERNREK